MKHTILLPARAPFALAPALKYVHSQPAQSGGSASSKTRLLHAFTLRDRTAACSIAATDNPGVLHCEIAAQDEQALDDALRSQAAEYLDRYLGLSVDLAGFYAVAKKDKRFVPVLERQRGYHPMRLATPLESAVWAVLSQATPPTIARKLLAAIAETYGVAANVDGAALTAFPDAQTLVDTPKGKLRDLIASERKAVTIQAIAGAFAASNESWLHAAESETLEAWLREIPGIGAWSSALILMRGFGRADFVPLDSVAVLSPILTATRRVYGPLFGGARLARMVERYGPYAGYWLHYMRAGIAR